MSSIWENGKGYLRVVYYNGLQFVFHNHTADMIVVYFCQVYILCWPHLQKTNIIMVNFV